MVAFFSSIIVVISIRGEARVLQDEENHRDRKLKNMSDRKFIALHRRVHEKSKLMWWLILIIALALTFAWDDF
ncbi:hypothetical protein GNF18_07575 [Ligilactobacillus pobuzihii]|uniref:hypothetical protein n=1 Tax=Ligilactobacillus pobuzihii TaxID=449659 RepID=UPI0019D05206|nr:hypothetical protein [Ligilactobacillus pobuzihii]MBN7274994.1 hypothetical protein [Ligilactobacillus pobuzihii]